MLERLQKYLAKAGIGSRRACETLITEGKVKVNGRVVTELGTKVDVTNDQVEVMGKIVEIDKQFIYLLLHKPAGYVTTAKDPQGRPTVLDLVSDVNHRVYPVGRLDLETEGLLLLTNDGELAYRLTHPKHKVMKTYEALVKNTLSKDGLIKLSNGVLLEDGITQPAKVRVLKTEDHKTLAEISIWEGRNRQVRRMFKAVGNPVLYLKRTKIGNLELKKLDLGKYRHLTLQEVELLYKQTGLK